MRQHVKYFIRNCPLWQKASTWVIPNPASFFYHLHQCFNIGQCLNIDRTSWLYTCHHLHIHEMGRMTQNTWRHCYIYTFPQICSDNGLYFAADVVKQFLLLWGVQPVKHYHTPVNTSIVERAIVTFVHYEESLSFMQSFLNLNYSIKLDVCYQFAFWTDNKFRLRILHHTSRKRGCGSNSPSPSHDELLAIQESFVKVAWDHIFSRYYSHF